MSEPVNSRLAVCVSTFRRPEGLKKLIRALDAMAIPPSVDLRFIIVDNERSSDSDVIPVIGDWPVRRVVEDRRGLSFSRNRAVAEAGDVDAIVFFDDDEQPHQDCLVKLVETWRSTGADVVQGGSVPVFEEEPPDWVVRRGYFNRDFETDGAVIPAYLARTSNVLIRRSLFDVADPPFDLRLSLIGSEDSFLFRTASDRGFVFVAAASAIVDEDVPASRVNRKWLIRRQYRIGWGRSFHLRAQRPGLMRRARRIGAGLVRILAAPKSGWRGRPGAQAMTTDAGRSVAYGCGLIVGLVGKGPAEYSDTHGR